MTPMKRLSLYIVVTLSLMYSPLVAQTKGLGFGLSLGDPTGLSVKAWISRTEAIQGTVGWYHQSSSHLTVEYLKHVLDAIRSSEQFPVYYGAGISLVGSEAVGIRGIAGIAWCSRKVPLDIFLQAAPTLYLVKFSEFDIDASLGIRYFF